MITQRRHDQVVRDILDQKNGEIEELKAVYRAEQRDSEERVRTLEEKVRGMLRESQAIHRGHQKRVGEQRKMYHHQAQAADQKVCALELQLEEQRAELEEGGALRRRLSQEKAQLEADRAGLSTELQEANRRNVSLMREHQQLSEEHGTVLRELRDQCQADTSRFQRKRPPAAAKVAEVIEDLAGAVAHLRRQRRNVEQRRPEPFGNQERQWCPEKERLRGTWVSKAPAVPVRKRKKGCLPVGRRPGRKKLTGRYRAHDALLTLIRDSLLSGIASSE